MIVPLNFLLRRHGQALVRLLVTFAACGFLSSAFAENPAEIQVDGDFLTSGLQLRSNLIRAGQKIGPWSVDMGNLELHVGNYAVPTGVGHVVDLNGTRSGSMYQTISVTRGTRYKVSFLMSGDWTTNPDLPRKLSLRFGSERVSFSLVRPPNWTKQNPQWQLMTAEFTAGFPATGLRFSSDSPGMADGPLISHVTVLGPLSFQGRLTRSPFRSPPNWIPSSQIVMQPSPSVRLSSGICRLAAMAKPPAPPATGMQVPTSARSIH